MTTPRAALPSLRAFLGSIACKKTTQTSSRLGLHKLENGQTETDIAVQEVVNSLVDSIDAVSVVDIGLFDPEGVGLDAALNAAIASDMVADGTTIDCRGLSGGPYTCGTTIEVTKAVQILFGAAEIHATVDPWLRSTGKNLVVRTEFRGACEVILSANVRAFALRGTFDGSTEPGRVHTVLGDGMIFTGGSGFHTRYAGTKVIDLTTVESPVLAGLTEGVISFGTCLIRYMGAMAITSGQSMQNCIWERLYFYGCHGCIKTGAESETTIQEVWSVAPPNGGDQFVLVGPKVLFGPKNVCLRSNVDTEGTDFADVVVEPQTSQNRGSHIWIKGNVFGPEGENLNDQRARIRITYPTDPTNVSMSVRIVDNLFGGTAVGTFWVKNVERDNAGACTATTCTSGGTTQTHGIPVGHTVTLMLTQSTDASFHETIRATATSTSAISWTSVKTGAAATLGASTVAGVLAQASAHAIEVVNPIGRLVVNDNAFINFRYGIKCLQGAEVAEDRGAHGQCVWGEGNTAYHHALPFTEFDGPPVGFSRVDPSDGSGSQRRRPRDVPALGQVNRVFKTLDLSASPWNVTSGLTVTPGQVGRRGSGYTTASRVQVATTYTPDIYALYQQIESTSLPETVWVSMWLKGDGTMPYPTAQLGWIENTVGRIWTQIVELSNSEWRFFEFPLTVVNAAHIHALTLCPGVQGEKIKAGMYVDDLRVADAPGDFVENSSTTLVAGSALVERRFNDLVEVTSLRGVQAPGGTVPTILAGFTGLGTTGTCTVMAGSSDVSGTIVLTPGGAGIAVAGVLDLVLGVPLPDTNPPTPIAVLGDYTGSWSNNAGLRAYINFGETSPWGKIRIIWANNGVAPGAGLEFRINYHIIRKS